MVLFYRSLFICKYSYQCNLLSNSGSWSSKYMYIDAHFHRMQLPYRTYAWHSMLFDCILGLLWRCVQYHHSGGIQFPICLIIFMSVKLPGSSNFEMNEFYHQMRISNKNISLWISLPMFLCYNLIYNHAYGSSGQWHLIFIVFSGLSFIFSLLYDRVEGGALSSFTESPCQTQWVLIFLIRAGNRRPGCLPGL